MKFLTYIFLMLFLFINNSISAEKNNCSIYKKLTAKHITCKVSNLKSGTVNTAGKIKKGTGNILMKTTGSIKGILKKN